MSPRSWRGAKQRSTLGVLLFLLLAACSQSSAPRVAPCSPDGHRDIARRTRISKPASGSIDEIDPEAIRYSQRNPTDLKRRPFDDMNVHGDQCRAVLGPLPVISCPDSKLVPITVDGRLMSYENGVFLENGKPTAWRPKDGCDRPGHIGQLFSKNPGNNPAEGCTPNVRMGGVRYGNVQWAWVCHSNHGVHEQHEPFDFVTVIGANMETGESCFFGHDVDGDPDPTHHTVARDVPPPGGKHAGDTHGRAVAKAFWEPGNVFVCLDCHGANGPFLTTPFTQQKRVGGDGTRELFPRYPARLRMDPGSGFRVIGTGHNVFMTNIPLLEPRRPKAIVPKHDDGTADRTCTRCHQVTDQEHFVRLARLAVGMDDIFDKSRREPAWMPPGIDRNDPGAVERAQSAVKRLERAWRDPAWRFSEKELLSPCPAPTAPAADAVTATTEPDGTRKVQWRWANDFGGVPLRDDVRFQVTIDGSDGSRCEIRDVAPQALGSADWKLTHPTTAGVEYRYKVQPYRYCFERQPFAYGGETPVPAKGHGRR